MSIETRGLNPEQKIAYTKEELPPLKDGHVRAVHLTGRDQVGNILQNGLDYSRHGMLMSMAQSYGQAEDAQLTSDDPRFSGPDIVAVVMDIPVDEHRLHETVGKAPGKIPPEYIVGIIGDI